MIDRRRFLRGAGVALALPALESMRPAFAAEGATPRRILAICNNLGFIPWKFFPAKDSADNTASPYLEMLKSHRGNYTVFSGVWHPDVDGGHPADNCFLTAAPHPGNGSFRNTISLDQYAAQFIGHQTRFPTLTLGVNIKKGRRSLSWTGAGVLIPCEERPSEVFKRLFLNGSPAEVREQIRRLETGRSVMDAVADQVRSLRGRVTARDRERLDQYLTGVREYEEKLRKAREWEDVPKPKTSAKMPSDPDDPQEYFAKTQLMFDMAQLALETDSTRLITLMLDAVNSPALNLEGTEITDGYHSLSHHGKSKKKLSQLESIDRKHLAMLDALFARFTSVKEGGETLLDRTMVLYGSNLGDANTHVTTNMPVLLAGGGFRHGKHLAFDRDRNYPLPNLFVSMLQRLGLEEDRFATSTGTMRGLESV